MTRLGKFANTSCFQLHLRKLGLMFEVLKRLERLEQLELLCILVATHRIMRSSRLIERLLCQIPDLCHARWRRLFRFRSPRLRFDRVGEIS